MDLVKKIRQGTTNTDDAEAMVELMAASKQALDAFNVLNVMMGDVELGAPIRQRLRKALVAVGAGVEEVTS
jgi:hypothetical protein